MENIGIKIGQLRSNANVSIAELAEAANIASDQMELIEKGELSPSISTLIKISRRLGTRLGTILDGEEINTPIISTKTDKQLTVSVSNGDSSLREHMNFFSLAQNKADRNMEPFMIEVEYKDSHTSNSSTHEGEEFIFVISGEVELRYGTDTHKLSKGDSAYYDSIVPHCVSTVSEGEKATVLAVTYVPH